MTEKENPNFIERFTVRMPDGMRDAIAERAKQNGRSMNSEIVDILNDALYLPSIDDGVLDYMLELANPENLATLPEEDRGKVEELLMQLVDKLTLKIERESASLRQIVGTIKNLKSLY